MKRSDLICENAGFDEHSGRVKHCEKYGTGYLSMEAGGKRYYTVFAEKGDLTACIRDILKELLPSGRALVAGLGNEDICSDSLGVKALRYIPATAHLSGHSEFSELKMRQVCVLEAGVTGKTGIESSGRIACIARYAGAELIIAIDSLACSGIERLCSTVQITDSGISPGSGVGNDRAALNRETCGVPVIAIGVPTVIDLESLTDGADAGKNLMVTPRSIDSVTEKFSRIIGTAVSLALNPTLTEQEIFSLII